MNEQPTCGKGLAANSVLPAKMADLISSLSTVLAVHLKALDLEDENSRQEHAAYSQLAKAYADIADSLRATAERMTGYRDLPMGRHDMKAMTASEPAEAFARFLNREQELLALLQARLPNEQTMLAGMKEAVGRKSKLGG
jgi:hypothetical protein